MIKLNKRNFPLKKNEVIPVKVKNISLISSVGIADGKMLPVVFLDCNDRPDIDKLLINHRDLKSKFGKIESAFGFKSRLNKRFLLLHLFFKEPIECNIIVEFDILKHGLGIDQLIKNQGCYIQSDSRGSRVSETMNEPRTLTEIPSEHIKIHWDFLYNNAITKDFQKKAIVKINLKKWLHL